MPRSRDLSQLLHFKPPELNATKRRLAAALTIEDLRSIAKRRTPKVAFDYADGAADTALVPQTQKVGTTIDWSA